MEFLPGRILIAPGNFHMRAVRGRMEIELNQEPLENSCRPAFDVLSRRRAHL
jgi:chemotaxis response regulator CheB